MIDAGGFHAGDDPRQLAEFLGHPGMAGAGVGVLLRIERLAVLADHEDQFLRAAIDAGEVAGGCFRWRVFPWVVSHVIVNPVVGG